MPAPSVLARPTADKLGRATTRDTTHVRQHTRAETAPSRARSPSHSTRSGWNPTAAQPTVSHSTRASCPCCLSLSLFPHPLPPVPIEPLHPPSCTPLHHTRSSTDVENRQTHLSLGGGQNGLHATQSHLTSVQHLVRNLCRAQGLGFSTRVHGFALRTAPPLHLSSACAAHSRHSAAQAQSSFWLVLRNEVPCFEGKACKFYRVFGLGSTCLREKGVQQCG